MSSADRGPGIRMRTLWLLRLIALVVSCCSMAGLVWAIFFAGDETPDLPRSGTAGQKVTDGWVEYRLVKTRCGLTSAPGAQEEKPEHGQFCELTVEAHNPSKTPAPWSAGLTAGNATYHIDWVLTERNSKSLPSPLGKHQRATGTMLFDIDKDAEPTELEIGAGDDPLARIDL